MSTRERERGTLGDRFLADEIEPATQRCQPALGQCSAPLVFEDVSEQLATPRRVCMIDGSLRRAMAPMPTRSPTMELGDIGTGRGELGA